MTRPPGAKKIIFVTFVRRAGYFEKRFFIKNLMANGLHIELWDLSRIFGTDGDMDDVQYPGYVKRFKRRSDVAAAIESDSSAIFIMLFDVEYRFLWIYRLLTKHRCMRYFFSWGAFPAYSESRKSLSLFAAIPEPGRLCRAAVLRVNRLLNLVKPFDVVLYAGTKAKEIVPGAGYYIPVNLPDVEEYCDLQADSSAPANAFLPEEGYVLFLDCYLPFHPDFRINNLKTIDAEKYRIAINAFFKRIERDLRMPVVIAAHPKSDYPHGYFGTRALIKNQTPQLVMRSSVVVSHYSTSTSFAVLWKKPIIFIYSDDMKMVEGATHMVPITAGMADALGMPIYNIDYLPQNIGLHSVREEVYERYRMTYITTHVSCDQRNREIFLQALSGPIAA